MSDEQHFSTTVDSQFGPLTLVATNLGLRAVLWPGDTGRRVPLPDQVADNPHHPILAKTRIQLKEYLTGERKQFEIPLDLRGTEFQQQAWQALADIPYGETASYSEQAMRIGRPRAVRAIGAANGRNPISIILPCHRVIGASGNLTGFAGGLETKSGLLELERSHADG